MDFDRIALLLHVEELTRPALHPKLKPIYDAAVAELEEHAAGAHEEEPSVHKVDHAEAERDGVI